MLETGDGTGGGGARVVRPGQRRPRSLSTASLHSHCEQEKRWFFRPSVALHFGLGLTYLVVTALWIITPLSWAYLLWAIISSTTSFDGLAAPPKLSDGPLGVLHYVLLAYCAIECPYSIYYRYLAIKIQKSRPFPQFSRQFLRGVFRQALANGLYEDAQGTSDLDSVLSMAEKSPPLGPTTTTAAGRFSLDSRHPYNMRNRRSFAPLSTPDLSKANLSPDRDSFFQDTKDDDTEIIAEQDEKSSTTTNAQRPPRKHAASFIQAPLAYNDPRAVDFREMMRNWFYGAPWTSIHKLNMADWLAWSLYNERRYEDLVRERQEWIKRGKPTLYVDGKEDVDPDHADIEPDKLGLVDHCVELIEARAAGSFPEGRNDAIKAIQLTLDPVKIVSRPFILYAFVWVFGKIMMTHVKRHGFKHVVDGDMEYIVKVPAGWQPDPSAKEEKQPLLFIHGLGLGLAQYASVVHYLATSPTIKDRPIVALIQPNVSMAFFHRRYLKPPSIHSSAGIKRLAERHKFDQTGMTVLSHSNGTIVHGWLIKKYPELCRRSCFVDPVCFGLWEPQICYQFLYAPAKTPVSIIIRYFVGREPGVALTLQRAFNWSDNLLFPSQIPNLTDPFHTAFFLASEDVILSAERVRRYLRRNGVREVASRQRGPGPSENAGLKMHWGRQHGESMIGSGAGFRQVMRWVMLEPDGSEDSEDEDDEGA